MSIDTTERETIASSSLRVYCPDELRERLYNMGRETDVLFRIETEDGKVTTIWLENPVTGRVEDVEAGAADLFVLHLIDTVIEVGEDIGRPWRARRETS